MADEIPKMLADHSQEVNRLVPVVVADAKSNPKSLPEYLDTLLSLEKKTRLSSDLSSSKVVVLAILNLIFELQKWDVLNDHFRLLCKRRAQLKPIVQIVVQEGVKFVDKVTSKSVKVELINVLREVSEGKIFVELERARLTRILASMLEADGKISEAADTLQDVQVEIMGTMEKVEKAEFLLEQIRLTMDKNDFVRAEIICKKVNKSVLGEEPEFEQLKLKFHRLMIRFYSHSDKYLDICQAYKAIYQSKSIQESKAEWQPVLRNLTFYALLSPHSPSQVEIVKWLRSLKNLETIPSMKSAIDLICTPELIGRPIPQEKEWASEFFSGEKSAQMKVDLDCRLIEHNLRLLANNYTRVTFPRLSVLLQLTPDETERHISDMVNDKSIFAKIDRPAGIVSFRQKRKPDIVLNEWSSDISDLLSLVEKTCHLINKEIMMYGL
uniref:PCI domain-containing protein n=1 Tax=Spongospora subterranea TaxID=70186 RepID=A0A0H5R4F7_9EUKA|eukprot:CRZ09090.1 hypothetical protein [Spongospora subterranea]